MSKSFIKFDVIITYAADGPVQELVRSTLLFQLSEGILENKVGIETISAEFWLTREEFERGNTAVANGAPPVVK